MLQHKNQNKTLTANSITANCMSSRLGCCERLASFGVAFVHRIFCSIRILAKVPNITDFAQFHGRFDCHRSSPHIRTAYMCLSTRLTIAPPLIRHIAAKRRRLWDCPHEHTNTHNTCVLCTICLLIPFYLRIFHATHHSRARRVYFRPNIEGCFLSLSLSLARAR